MTYSTITSKGQITIPKDVRDKLKLKKGDRIDFRVRNSEVVLVPVIKKVSDVFGILRKENQKTISVEKINQALKKTAGSHGK